MTCTGVDRAALLRDGYVILRSVVPPHELARVRDAYEILVERQEERTPGWKTTGAQPRLNVRPDPVLTSANGNGGLKLDDGTAPAIEIWCHPNLQRASSLLLGVEDAGVTEMMLMTSPTTDRGPARWHRDFNCAHASPMQGYAADILEAGGGRCAHNAIHSMFAPVPLIPKCLPPSTDGRGILSRSTVSRHESDTALH
jgi:hypothetical protein